MYKEKIKIKEFSLWLKVLVSFLPVGIVGFIFKDYIKEFFSIEVVASMFILGGIFILFFENFYKKKKKIDREIEKITYKQALSIGVFQLFSFIPGTSRSLTTIFGGMYFNFTRKTATEFSFLMALPVMFAVCFYEIYSSYGSIVNSEYKYLILGFILSFIFTFFILKLFLKFVQRFSFNFFGIYRIIFGIILFLFFI